MAANYAVGETDERPWGRWEVLGAGDGHVVKRITVKPGKRLSLQRHFHRAERWVVVAGRGLVTLGEETLPIGVGEAAHIPVLTIHRIENTGAEDLVFVEVQLGDHLDEGDIERLQDDAGRV